MVVRTDGVGPGAIETRYGSAWRAKKKRGLATEVAARARFSTQPLRSYQSNLTPNFAMRGGITVVAFSNATPDRQLMLIAVFELSALNMSKKSPVRAFAP